MPNMIANRAFRYASRELAANEEFEAESKDVLVLTSTNNPLARASDSAGDDDTDLMDQNKKKMKRYNRRDMRAEE